LVAEKRRLELSIARTLAMFLTTCSKMVHRVWITQSQSPGAALN